MCDCKGWPPIMDSDANQLGTSLYNGANGDARESDSKNCLSSLLLKTHTEARCLVVILSQDPEALNVTVLSPIGSAHLTFPVLHQADPPTAEVP